MTSASSTWFTSSASPSMTVIRGTASPHRRDVGDIPAGVLAGLSRREPAPHEIRRRRGARVGDRGAPLAAPAVFGVDAVSGLSRSTRLWLVHNPGWPARRLSSGGPIGVAEVVMDLVHVVDDQGLVPLGVGRTGRGLRRPLVVRPRWRPRPPRMPLRRGPSRWRQTGSSSPVPLLHPEGHTSFEQVALRRAPGRGCWSMTRAAASRRNAFGQRTRRRPGVGFSSVTVGITAFYSSCPTNRGGGQLASDRDDARLTINCLPLRPPQAFRPPSIPNSQVEEA